MKNKKLKRIKLDEFGQIPLALGLWLFENNPEIKVSSCYLERILGRLVYLQKIAKNNLAEADIPDTVDYIIGAIPEKIINKYIKDNK